MTGRLRNNLMKFPLTFGLITAAVGLFLAVEVYRIAKPASRNDAQWHLGAVTPLTVVAAPDLNGPLNLWDGDWWRIAATAFHHGDPLHLLMNCLGLWFLGRLLESRMTKLGYLTFLLFATVIPMLPELLFENYPVGLSGMAYAMFGLLMVVRRYDPFVANIMNENVVKLGVGWLFACILLTAFDILQIANIAHFSGFGYGWLMGRAFFDKRQPSQAALWGVRAAHLLVLPAVYFVLHPIWIGRYHGYVAFYEVDPVLRQASIKRALSLDEGLPSMWRALADSQFRQGQPIQGWTTLLKCLRHNRMDEKTAEICRKIWGQHLTPSERHQALAALSEVFGDEHQSWQDRLQITADDLIDNPSLPWWANGNGIPETPLEFSFLVPPIEGGVDPAERDLSAPQVDPNAPDSACVGTTL